MKRKNIINKIFYFVAITAAIAVFAWTICVTVYFSRLGMGSDVLIVVFAGTVTDVLWIFFAIKYFRACNTEQSAVEEEKSQSLKKFLFRQITTNLLLMIVTFFVCSQMDYVMDYLYIKKMKNLYKDYWIEHRGERADQTLNEVILKEWNTHYSNFTVWDQGGTIYYFDNYGTEKEPYIEFKVVYDADWEGVRAMDRYTATLDSEGWVYEDSRYLKKIDDETYIIDIGDWDWYNKHFIYIEYYTDKTAFLHN